MSTGTRVPLARATAIASELRDQLAPGCDKIHIAGSIRRRRPDVGDIELVAVPHFELMPDGLFETKRQSMLELAIDTLLVAGTLASHPTDPKRGDRYAKLVHPASGLQVDLFTARLETFGVIWLIRTGPAAFSRDLVTDAKRRGHHFANGELHQGSLGCGSSPCKVVDAWEEQDVFSALRRPYVLPVVRA